MKRRTFISLMGVMAAAGVLSMTGCSSKDTAASTASSATLNKLDSIQKSGKLVVALEGAWQPWSYHDSSDTLVGFDVEVSRAIAEKLGVEPEYVESDWDSLFAGLDAGRYDMVCNGVEVTEDRAKATSINLSADDLTTEKLAEYQQAQAQVRSALGRLIAVAESYPDLKANQNFLELQAQLEGTENRIAVARKDFNAAAQQYNVSVRRFPANLVAKVFGFGQKPYFEAAEGTETAPRVQF